MKLDLLDPMNLPDELGGPINAAETEELVERDAAAALIGEDPPEIKAGAKKLKLARHLNGATSAILEYLESPFLGAKEGKDYKWAMESNIFIAVHTLPWDVVKKNYKNREKMEDLALDIGALIDAESVGELTNQILRVIDKEQQHQVALISEGKDIEEVALGGSPGKP